MSKTYISNYNLDLQVAYFVNTKRVERIYVQNIYIYNYNLDF